MSLRSSVEPLADVVNGVDTFEPRADDLDETDSPLAAALAACVQLARCSVSSLTLVQTRARARRGEESGVGQGKSATRDGKRERRRGETREMEGVRTLASRRFALDAETGAIVSML